MSRAVRTSVRALVWGAMGLATVSYVLGGIAVLAILW